MFKKHPMETRDFVAKLRFRLSHVGIFLQEHVQRPLQQADAIAGLDQSVTRTARGPIADALADESTGCVGDEALRWISPCNVGFRTEITDVNRHSISSVLK